jgi:hypothetical protein
MTIATTVRPVSHSRQVKRTIDWGASGFAGLAGGLAFMAIETMAAAFAGRGALWQTPREIAAILFGGLINGRPIGTVIAVAICFHLMLSLLYGRALAYVLFKRGNKHWLQVGILFGLSLYILNYYILGAFIPRIAAARSTAWLFCHLGFGAVAAGVYKRFERLSEEV